MGRVFKRVGTKKVKELVAGDLIWVLPFNYQIMEVVELEEREHSKYGILGYIISEHTGDYDKNPHKHLTIRGYHGSELVTLVQRINT